jgi:2-keto-3-deoxy-L-rhamnonate aldolase RhmA
MPSTMQAANRLRTTLNEGKGAALGCWQMIPGSNVSRTLARTGVDWVLVDCEHGNIDGQSTLRLFFTPSMGSLPVLAFASGEHVKSCYRCILLMI